MAQALHDRAHNFLLMLQRPLPLGWSEFVRCMPCMHMLLKASNGHNGDSISSTFVQPDVSSVDEVATASPAGCGCAQHKLSSAGYCQAFLISGHIRASSRA